MTYELEDIARSLKAARLAKGLSQRALSAKTGLTQAHISKIENANVDLQLSNLIELARALDIELTLVPVKSIPALRGGAHLTAEVEAQPRPAYSLDEEDEDV
ncbi:MAG: helix-turn-helix transcriptional regulator [Rhodospirillales bacterium]|jgi:transcriptional regulator with XRE-family HTH domain|nr:helix-turn-helix transcriptional regulator [Rhodospirillales bacterium]